MTDSYIEHSKSHTAFVGPDAANFLRAATLMTALKLYAQHRILTTRNATPTVLLKIATEYTGKKYKRGAHAQAAEDVRVWCDNMRAALPHSEV